VIKINDLLRNYYEIIIYEIKILIYCRTKNKFVSHYLCILSTDKKEKKCSYDDKDFCQRCHRRIWFDHNMQESKTNNIKYLLSRRFSGSSSCLAFNREPYTLDLMATNQKRSHPERWAEIFANLGNDP